MHGRTGVSSCSMRKKPSASSWTVTSPTRDRFDRSMGEIVETVGGPGTGIRAFGEMVAVLWAHGNVEGALALEDLWNVFIAKHSLRLFCAYPFEAVSQIQSGLDAVCDKHSHILVPPNRELSS